MIYKSIFLILNRTPRVEFLNSALIYVDGIFFYISDTWPKIKI